MLRQRFDAGKDGRLHFGWSIGGPQRPAMKALVRLTIPSSSGASISAHTGKASEPGAGIGHRLSQISSAMSVAAT